MLCQFATGSLWFSNPFVGLCLQFLLPGGGSKMPYPTPPRVPPELFPLSKRRPVADQVENHKGLGWFTMATKRILHPNGRILYIKMVWHTNAHGKKDSTYNACVCMHGLCHHTLILYYNPYPKSWWRLCSKNHQITFLDVSGWKLSRFKHLSITLIGSTESYL